MSRQALRQQLHIIPGTLPQKPAFAEQVMNLKRMARVQSDRGQIDAEPARLDVKAIKIHNNDDYAGEIIACLAVTKNGRIISFVKPEVAISL